MPAGAEPEQHWEGTETSSWLPALDQLRHKQGHSPPQTRHPSAPGTDPRPGSTCLIEIQTPQTPTIWRLHPWGWGWGAGAAGAAGKQGPGPESGDGGVSGGEHGEPQTRGHRTRAAWGREDWPGQLGGPDDAPIHTLELWGQEKQRGIKVPLSVLWGRGPQRILENKRQDGPLNFDCGTQVVRNLPPHLVAGVRCPQPGSLVCDHHHRPPPGPVTE